MRLLRLHSLSRPGPLALTTPQRPFRPSHVPTGSLRTATLGDWFPRLTRQIPWLMVWLCRGKLPELVDGPDHIALHGHHLSTIAPASTFGIDDIAGPSLDFPISFLGPRLPPLRKHALIARFLLDKPVTRQIKT